MNNQSIPKISNSGNGGAKTPSLSANTGEKNNVKMANINKQKSSTPSGKRAEDYKNSLSNNKNEAAKQRVNNLKNNMNNLKKFAAKEGIKKAAAAYGVPEPVVGNLLNSKLGDKLIDEALKKGDPAAALEPLKKVGKGAIDASKKINDAFGLESEKSSDQKSDEREAEKVNNGEITFEFSGKTIKYLAIIAPVCFALLMFVMIVVVAISDDKASSMILAGLSSDERGAILDQFGNGSGEIAYNTVGKGTNEYPKSYYERLESLGNVYSSDGKCKGADCMSRAEFLYYLKIADISLRYQNKYGVQLDWFLIAATNLYQDNTNEETMEKNTGGYDKDTVENMDTPSLLDWDNDFKNMDGYTYLDPNDSKYDLNILAKNMVTKKTYQSCTKNGTVTKNQEDTDVEDMYFTPTGGKKLICAAGETYSIYSTYTLDKDKYDEFMLEYIDKKMLTPSTGGASGSGCYYWPLKNGSGTITSKFGNRKAPTQGASTNHKGLDIGVPEGTEIVATIPGTVTRAGTVDGFGYAVYIDHGNDMVSKYGHIRADGIKVKVGDKISQGQVIALSGNTGISTGPHLHFQLEMSGNPVDPLDYVSQDNPAPTSCRTVSGNSLSNGFVKLALAQINDPEGVNGKKYWQFMGFNSRVPWCAAFVSWVVQNTNFNGQRMASIVNYRSASVNEWMKYFNSGTGKIKFYYNDNCSKYAGKNGSGKYMPKEGDMIFFDWDQTWNGNFPPSGPDHIGIVQHTRNGVITTIEGNTSNKVAERTYNLNSCKVVGFGSWY